MPQSESTPSESPCQVYNRHFYAGFVHHKESRRLGAHEPILSEDLWQAAQARTQRVRKTRQFDTLLTGIAECSSCGGPVWTAGTTRSRTSRYYQEPAHKQFRECANASTTWRTAEADAIVSDIITSMGMDETWLKTIERLARRVPSAVPDDNAALRARRRRVTNAYLADAIAEDEWKATIRDIDMRLARTPPPVEHVLRATESLRSMADLWNMATDEEKREGVRVLFNSVRLDTRGHRLWVEPKAECRALFEWRVSGSTPDRTGGLLHLRGDIVFGDEEILRAASA